jgi:sugar lactone lactonase YvrE
MRIARLLFLSLVVSAAFAARADDTNPFGVTVTTLITTPLSIEGLTNDDTNLYVPGRQTAAGQPCPVWRVPLDNPTLTIVGLVPAPSASGTCSPSGLAFGPDGQLYVTQTDSIYRFIPNAASPPTATLFAIGVPGTNGLAFDWNGNLWTGDGTTGQGRVWMITAGSTVTEVFRIPPMANEVNLVAGTGGIGRDVRTLGPGTIAVTPTSRNAANTLGSQPLVANGLQFDSRGNLYIADSARGAIWRVHIRRDSTASVQTGCDTTFTANTLCLDHVFVTHPILEGADGFVMDVAGNMWVDANERNAIGFVTAGRQVLEVFRNLPDVTTHLRNTGPLETPTSPVLVGHKLCTANSDGNRRDNFPSTAGEIGGTGQPRGKISCIDQRISVRGMPLPVR